MVMEQFSSYQIGNMLNVSRQAVNQWIDKGYIHSYRTPGGHRRVRRDDLYKFLHSREIPIPEELREGADAEMRNGAGSFRMVHVDNDGVYAETLDRALGALVPGAKLRTFDNALDALVGMGADSPDLLVMDPDLAEVDGPDLCRRLRQNERTRRVKIAFVTSRDCEEVRAATDGIALVDCYSKDVPVNEIARGLAAAMEISRVGVN